MDPLPPSLQHCAYDGQNEVLATSDRMAAAAAAHKGYSAPARMKRPAGVARAASSDDPVSEDGASDGGGGAVAAAAAAVAAAAAPPPPASKRARAAPVLPWMRVPLAVDPADGVPLDAVGGLDPRLAAALRAAGVEALFPAQAAVWRATAGGASARHDVALAAPTGSGKTLAYALPVLQALAGRAAAAPRALVVTPARDLALQVHAVLAALAPALGLTVAVAAGGAPLAAEAAVLVGGGGRAAPDVVVATPGRLAAHLRGTPGFTLRALRFLVVDEMDRLLRQGYQGWLPTALAGVGGGGAGGGGARCVKFVVSATLSRDPSKLARLGLACPRYVALASGGAGGGDARYALPPGLTETLTIAPAARKPAALAALLAAAAPAPALVFAASVDAAHRLALLLAALLAPGGAAGGGGAAEYSAALPPAARRAALAAFASGAARVLVCSDAAARGLDLPRAALVVNYDPPVYARTYVHRAGRTARAGRAGRVATLARPEEARHLRALLAKVEGSRAREEKLGREALAAAAPGVEAALTAMGAALRREEDEARAGARGGPPAPRAVGGAVPAGAAAGRAARRRRHVGGVPEAVL
jgi:ATP-dependent RNA helicase DDX51/DBP6